MFGKFVSTMYLVAVGLSVALCFTNNYRIVYERAVRDHFDKQYFEYADVMNTYYNRSTRTFSAKMHLLKDLTNARLKLMTQAYVYLNNEYKLYPPIRFELKFCEALSKNLLTVGELLLIGNLTKCPIHKGYYHFNNFRGDESAYPPFIPFGKYRIQVSLLDGKAELCVFSAYVAVINKSIN